MLFLLTGDVQIGKTRWLERLASELSAEGCEVSRGGATSRAPRGRLIRKARARPRSWLGTSPTTLLRV